MSPPQRPTATDTSALPRRCWRSPTPPSGSCWSAPTTRKTRRSAVAGFRLFFGQNSAEDDPKGINPAIFALPPVREKPMSDEKLRALPRDVPDYHARQAAHLRALAENATTARLKARLIDEAEQHDRLAAATDEPQ